MKKTTLPLIFSIFLSFGSTAIADIGVGCYDSVIVIQTDIHAESGKPSSQAAHINQQQSPNCTGNININTIHQTHFGFDGASQNVNVDSYQASPPGYNDDININTPNLKTAIIVQEEILVPDSTFK